MSDDVTTEAGRRKVLREIDETVIKNSPHIPPWLLDSTMPDPAKLAKVLYAFDKGELIWQKPTSTSKDRTTLNWLKYPAWFVWLYMTLVAVSNYNWELIHPIFRLVIMLWWVVIFFWTNGFGLFLLFPPKKNG